MKKCHGTFEIFQKFQKPLQFLRPENYCNFTPAHSNLQLIVRRNGECISQCSSKWKIFKFSTEIFKFSTEIFKIFIPKWQFLKWFLNIGFVISLFVGIKTNSWCCHNKVHSLFILSFYINYQKLLYLCYKIFIFF